MKRSLNAPSGIDVDIWPFDLSQLVGDEAVLDEREKHRADRFVFERDRIQFIAAHAATRRLLGNYLGIAPERCTFEIGPNGKPALAGTPTLRFSLAHSGDRALLAVSSGADVGVDIEASAFVGDPASVAAEVVSEEEAEALRSLPPAEFPQAFLQLWTRKEAALKAFGTGLSNDPRGLSVGHTAGKRYAQCQASGWRAAVCTVEVEGCSAAVARLDDLGTVTVHRSFGK